MSDIDGELHRILSSFGGTDLGWQTNHSEVGGILYITIAIAYPFRSELADVVHQVHVKVARKFPKARLQVWAFESATYA
jgi:hypothetical protein